MTDKTNQGNGPVLGFGGALVDMLAPIAEEELATLTEAAKGDVRAIGPSDFRALMTRLQSRPVRRTAGGSVGNTLRVMRRNGLPATLLSAVGDDENGAFLTQAYQADGVDVSALHAVPGCLTDCCLALVTPDGERTMLPLLDAGRQQEALRFPDALFQEARHLHLEGYAVRTPEATAAVLRQARAAGVPVSMDLGAVSLLKAHRAFYEGLRTRHEPLEWLFGNAAEAAELAGATRPSEAAARLLSAGFARNAVVTCGAGGAWTATADGNAAHIPAAPLPGPLVDTVGAGDTFTGAFLAAILRGAAPAEAGRQAATAAAECVCHAGA